VEDYGKVAATFIDMQTGRAVRVAPALDIRRHACAYAPDEPRHYFAQMLGYQVMPDEEMFTIIEVQLTSLARYVRQLRCMRRRNYERA